MPEKSQTSSYHHEWWTSEESVMVRACCPRGAYPSRGPITTGSGYGPFVRTSKKNTYRVLQDSRGGVNNKKIVYLATLGQTAAGQTVTMNKYRIVNSDAHDALEGLFSSSAVGLRTRAWQWLGGGVGRRQSEKTSATITKR